MKRFQLLLLLTLLSLSVLSQKKSMDFGIYNDWKTVGNIIVSDDANVVITEYNSHNQKSLIHIRIKNSNFTIDLPGVSNPKFIDNQNSALFKMGDSLVLFNIGTFKTDTLAGVSKVKSRDDSRFLTFYDKDKNINVFDVRNSKSEKLIFDSIIVNTYDYLSPESVLLLVSDTSKGGSKSNFVFLNLSQKNFFEHEFIYGTERYIEDFRQANNGRNIVFFSSADSAGIKDVRADLLKWGKKEYKKGVPGFVHEITNLNQSLIPGSMKFNIKKGITFSENDDYFKFEISYQKNNTEDKKKEKTKPKFEYELWRWNDTLLPTQKRRNQSVFADNLRCLYRPDSDQFVQLSRGNGVYLMVNDNAPFSIEIDASEYLPDDMWRDPLPKDFYYTNVRTGEHKQILKAFEGSFFVSSETPYMFIYEFETESWFAFNPEDGTKINLSEGMPYPVNRQDFDKPQPAGAYGKAGISDDLRYVLVYDEFDIWALPMDGDKKGIFCLTEEFGRKNNMKFKLLNMSGTKPSSDLVNIKENLILESVNLDNMHMGFYKLTKGKKLERLVEGPYKYSYVKTLKNGSHIIKKENFNEAPDFWIADKDFVFKERITNINDQLVNYNTGKSEVIGWKDGSDNHKGILYTPEGYDSTKTYPVIVYFYETMTQDAFAFYNPEPTTSTINPLMFVSRGYVVFMPDIKYEIGWPGESSRNIVVSGTEFLIESKIADPEKIGIQGHSWGGYQVAYIITQTNLFKCACTETAVANMTSAYSGLRAGPGKTRMFMYESTQSRIGGNLWEKQENYIKNSPVFYLDQVTTPLLSRHSDGDEAVPFTQGLELFLGLKRLGKPVWMFNYKGDGHNIKKREIAEDWTVRMDQYFDYYLMGKEKPEWM